MLISGTVISSAMAGYMVNELLTNIEEVLDHDNLENLYSVEDFISSIEDD